MDELEIYYEYLRKNKADVPDSFDSFRSTLQDEQSAKTYFDYLKKNNFDAPDTYDSFAATFGLKKKVPTPLQPGDVGPEEQGVGLAPSFGQPLQESVLSQNGSVLPEGNIQEPGVIEPVQSDEELQNKVNSGEIHPAVANAFQVSRRGKELQQTVKAQKAEIVNSVNDFAKRKLAEKQLFANAGGNVDQLNAELRSEVESFHQEQVNAANAKIAEKYDKFQQAANSQLADPEFTKGFIETYTPSPETDIEKWRVTDSKIGKSLAEKLWSTITDQLPGGLASGMAGSLSTDYGDILLEKAKQRQRSREGLAPKPFKKTKEEVIQEYIDENGREQYDKEAKEFTTSRVAQKEELLKYSTRQRGEAEGKLYKYPKTWEEAVKKGQIGEYIAGNIGQVAGLAIPTVIAGAVNPALGGAVGYGTMSMMEKGESYEEGIALLEKSTGLSKKQLFTQDTDKLLRSTTTKSGLINGMFEYIGQVSTVGRFMPKSFVTELFSKLSNSPLVRVPVGTLMEGVTEWIQAKDTHYAAAIGAGKSHDDALNYSLNQDDSEEFIAGLTGGGGLSVISQLAAIGDTKKGKPEVVVEKPKVEPVTENNGAGIEKEVSEPIQPNAEGQEKQGDQEAVRQDIARTEPVVAEGTTPVLTPSKPVDTEPGGEKFESLRSELEDATGQEYSDEAVQEHVDAAGGWDVVSQEESQPESEVNNPSSVFDTAKQLRPMSELKAELVDMRKTLADWKKQGKDKYDPESYAALENQIATWARTVGTNLTGMTPEEIEQTIMPEKDAPVVEYGDKQTYYQGIPKTTSFMQALLDKDGNPLVQGSLEDVEKYKKDNGIKDDTVRFVDLDTSNPNSLINKFLKKKVESKTPKEIAKAKLQALIDSGDLEKTGTGYKVLTDKGGKELKAISEELSKKAPPSLPEKSKIRQIADASEGRVIIASLPKEESSTKTFGQGGKFKVLGVNSDGEVIGEDKNGVRARLRGNGIVTQPVGIIPGRGIVVDAPSGEYLTVDEQNEKDKSKQVETKKSDVIRGEIKQLFGELDDLIGPSIRKQMVGEQEQDRLNKIAAVGAKIVGKYVELGVTRFAEIAKEIYTEYGEKALKDYFSAMKEGYARYIMAAESIENFDDFYKVKSYKEQELIDSFKPQGDELRALSNTDGGNAREVSGGDVSSKTGKPVSQQKAEPISKPVSGVSPKSNRPDDGGGKKRTGSTGDSDITTPDSGLRTDGGEQVADESKTTKPDTKKSIPVENQNHVIEDSDSIVPSGEIAKIKANIEAIKLVQLLDKEKRNATPAEKKILAKYVGWGGLAPVLDRSKARNAWDDNWLKKYEKYYKEIDELLTDDEFQNAVNSTINAHYTDRRVIGALWDIAKRLGFKGGNVMEPSAGVGHFFGLMPKELAQNSNLKAYELDKITGQILSKLYPQAQVRITGYEEAVEGNNSQDLIITNVPFGASAPFDARYQELSKFSLHNYFIAKGIQQLKPGGLGIFITSMSSMDNPGASTKFREWTNNEGNADFVGAIRLPNNIFSENAGTEVTTDILIYKKRTSEHPSDLNQVYRNVIPIKETKGSDGKQVEIVVNEYYASNPDMMLGEMMLAHEAGSGGLYRADVQTMKAPAGQDTLALLQDRIKSLPEDIFGAEKTQVIESSEKAEATDKDGTFKESNGKIFMVDNGELIPQPWTNETVTFNSKSYKKSDVIKDYLGVKKAITDLVNAEHSELKDDELGKQREALNKAFDSFVKKYGNFSRNKRFDFLEDDSDHNVVFALENIKKESTLNEKGNIRTIYRIDKSDIFTKRVNYPYSEPTKAQDIGDAMNISLSYRGKIDLSYIGKLINLSEADAREQLLTSKLAFENPKSGLLEDADSYLSGFVRTKLREAEEEAKVNQELERNVSELRKVVPKDIPAAMIEFKLGSTWIPNKYIEDWVKATLGVESKISYNDKTGSWIVRNMRGVHDGRNQTAYATKDFTAMELIEKALNLRQPEVVYTIKDGDSKRTVKDAEATAAAQAKMQELADMFYNNVKSNKEAMEEIEKVYNNIYNDFIEKKYSLPTFTHYPGANKSITLRLHQRRPIARALSDSVLLAHQVGTGKTFTLITIAMEMRRLNTAKKPMVVVQNATLEQFAASFLTLYPSAKILVPTKQQMDANNRQKLFNRIAYNDWDAVIIPQSFLDFIPDDPVRERAILNEQLAELEAALNEAETEGDRGAQSELKRIIKGLEKQLEETDQPKKGRKVKDQAKVNLSAEKAQKKQASRRMDDVFNFESMGVDALLVDEAHAYKKLGFLSKMSRIKGIDIGRSKRSFGLFMKVRWVQEKNKGKNIVLATGTPITNTMAEVWTMMRYTSPDILKKYGISTFDEFASTFGQVEPSLEFTASGSFKIVERFKSYINAPELLTAFRSKTDVVLTEDVPEFKESNAIPKLKEQPDGKRGFTNVIIPQTEALAQMMETFKQILKAWEKLSGKEKKAQRHIPLLVFNRAKQAAIDLRLINATNADDPGSKTNKVVKEAKRIYDETASYNGTQLIFSDMYQSPEVKDEFLDEDRTVRNPNYGGKRFNLYEDIKAKLVKSGIPADQIAIIQDYEGERRNVLFTKINSGEVRILLGSTEKMGVGVNVQERLAALHHIDAPPRPMDFEQRNGRIIRQGNTHAEMSRPVEILTFGVEKTLDATAYQRLAIKQKFINQMMKAEGIDRDMKDDADEDSASDLTFDQMMSELSGSQFAMLHMQRSYELRKLRTAKNNYERSIIDFSSQIKHDKRLIEAYKLTEDRYKPMQKEFKTLFPEDKVTSITVDGATYTEKFGEPLQKFIEKKFKELEGRQALGEMTSSITVNDGVPVVITFYKKFSISAGANRFDATYLIYSKENKDASIRTVGKVETGQGLMTSMNSTIHKFTQEGWNGDTDINDIQGKIKQKEKDIEAIEKMLDKPFDKGEKLTALEQEVADLEKKMQEETKDKEPQPPDDTPKFE